MNPTESRRPRLAAALAAPAVVAVLLAVLAAPAGAAAGHGTAHFRLADHDRGRTLSGQGVEIVAAGGGASRDGRWLTLPISDVEAGDDPVARSGAWVRFERGSHRVALTDIRFDLEAGQIVGELGGEQMPVFWTGARSQIHGASGEVSVRGGALRLIRRPATLLKRRLALKRALVGKGVGMVWMAARTEPQDQDESQEEKPTHVAHGVASGSLDWGVLASWRGYVLAHIGPPSPPAPSNAGEIVLGGGATASGPLIDPESFVSFPAGSGTLDEGANGTSDRLTVTTEGSVSFEKPGHCIIEVRLAELRVRIDGADSAIVLDAFHDIDKPEGMSCGPLPPGSADDIEFAALDVSGVTPEYSAGGDTVTWMGVPATLTEAGRAAFGGTYPAGQALDPVTVTAELE